MNRREKALRRLIRRLIREELSSAEVRALVPGSALIDPELRVSTVDDITYDEGGVPTSFLLVASEVEPDPDGEVTRVAADVTAEELEEYDLA